MSAAPKLTREDIDAIADALAERLAKLAAPRAAPPKRARARLTSPTSCTRYPFPRCTARGPCPRTVHRRGGALFRGDYGRL